jgi:L-fuconolactonase
MKMGGLGMPASGLNLYLSQVPPSSEDLSVAWKPYIDACVEAFGANRCMIGSNFPVDRQTANYTTLWNAYKLATQAYSKDERHHLFSGTASRVYNIQNKTLVN